MWLEAHYQPNEIIIYIYVYKVFLCYNSFSNYKSLKFLNFCKLLSNLTNIMNSLLLVLFLTLSFNFDQLNRFTFAAVDLDSFLPFGIAAGDARVPPGRYTFVGPIPLYTPFPFFSNLEKEFYVGTTGLISFADPMRFQYAPPHCNALQSNWRSVVAFWASVDTNFGGGIFYRQSQEPRLLQALSREVSEAYPQFYGIDLKSLLVATWFEVNSCGQSTINCQGHPFNNTFQAILTTDGTYSFAILYYNRVTYTTPDWYNQCGPYPRYKSARVCLQIKLNENYRFIIINKFIFSLINC